MSWQHGFEIMVGADVESRKHLVEQLAVLRGHANARAEFAGPDAQPRQDRTQFDGLRTGAEDE